MSLNGILIVDKPSGMTSHDVVAIMRRAGRERRLGHTGTLDPTATGVLVLCFGIATRLIPFLDETDKTYLAHLILGVSTDTQDFTGQTIKETPDAQIERERLKAALQAYQGEIMQIPPMFSAVKQQGRPLYELARQGKEVERAPRPVTIYELEPEESLLESYRAGEGPWLRVRCSKGTYIRTLCHDLGEYLGCGAHLRELKRTTSGTFHLEEAVSLEEAQTWGERGELGKHLLSPARAVAHLKQLSLSKDNVSDVKHGRCISGLELESSGVLAAGIDEGELAAILKSVGDGRWQPVKVFV
jgi:tRNA pseudouridine55 synthase